MEHPVRSPHLLGVRTNFRRMFPELAAAVYNYWTHVSTAMLLCCYPHNFHTLTPRDTVRDSTSLQSFVPLCHESPAA